MKMTEHLLFAALMLPTFVVLVAAAVSLGHPDPKVVTADAVQAVVAESPADAGAF